MREALARIKHTLDRFDILLIKRIGCPTTLSPRVGWEGQPLSYIALRRVHVAGTDGQRCPTHGRNEVTVGPKRRKADFSHGNSFRSNLEDRPLNCLDRAIYSELRIDINQEVDVVRYDLGFEMLPVSSATWQ